MIDLARLIACGLTPSVARAFEAPLAIACAQFGITTPQQQAGFLAQAMHESQKLTKLEESLYYSTTINILRAYRRLGGMAQSDLSALVKNPKALALAAYSNVNGNGGPETGDGWTYRGGGPFQLTGRKNYQACATALGRPFVDQPGLLRVAGTDAALSAAWFWHTTGCNALMDNLDFEGTTRRINGPAMLGAAERRELYYACSQALQ